MRIRRSLAATSLAFSAALVVAGPAPLACAGPGPDATLVIDTGNAERLLCVALDSDSVSGIRLIELASQQYGFSYSLGYGGQAVCMIAGVGSAEEECFEGGGPFWGYWRSNGSSWTWSGTGAGGTVVEDGDVEGWSWGTGNDGGSHQQPPFTSHEAVCGAEQGPAPGGGGGAGGGGKGAGDREGGDGSGQGGSRNAGDDGPKGGSEASGPSATAAADAPAEEGRGAPRKQAKRRDPLKKTKRLGNGKGWTLFTDTAADPNPAASPSPSAAPVASSSDAPPVAGVIGLFVAILFGLAGAWFMKRRHVPQG